MQRLGVGRHCAVRLPLWRACTRAAPPVWLAGLGVVGEVPHPVPCRRAAFIYSPCSCEAAGPNEAASSARVERCQGGCSVRTGRAGDSLVVALLPPLPLLRTG